MQNMARDGGYPAPAGDAKALVFWIDVFGVQKDDLQILEMYDPRGGQMLKSESKIPGNKAAWFSYAGKPRPPQGWMKGTYRAEYRLLRKGMAVATTIRRLEIP